MWYYNVYYQYTVLCIARSCTRNMFLDVVNIDNYMLSDKHIDYILAIATFVQIYRMQRITTTRLTGERKKTVCYK